ncbi:hypothetical protein [Roseivirga pacifica]|uniref:hypothetical protein n=1 Tax=Roseivirga pacifica TaxID=1267423 RepID=UPI002094BA0C|nr:hypothetical protein [Roseivirga pacifica]MCO6357717.1 hypothetical protein [Roseivirga pacifica]MCO6365970.1 hypothetical protein [Roseivirga pacifica]MCO6371298.1 hypothetical protein [Roseivirga pacifica]MCO6375531.1 hypothetical protein [Roseivirga pacifica]MCO6378676.1 hypothetical protein [Roseivirga pacifica]
MKNRVNDVRAYGLGFVYRVTNAVNLQLEYNLDQVEHVDLKKRFFNSSYHFKVLYEFKITKRDFISPSVGFSVINRVDYGIAQVQIRGEPDTKSTTVYYYGKEPFSNWSLGLSYNHRLTDSLIIGMGVNTTYNFSFGDGRTYLMIYFSMPLVKK